MRKHDKECVMYHLVIYHKQSILSLLMLILSREPTKVMEMYSNEAIFSSIYSQPNPPTSTIFISLAYSPPPQGAREYHFGVMESIFKSLELVPSDTQNYHQ